MEEETRPTIGLKQMLDASEYVRSYIAFNGGDPYDIDWDHPPKFLPEDVRAAWDTRLAFQEWVMKEGIEV